jgi:hypothetical protein
MNRVKNELITFLKTNNQSLLTLYDIKKAAKVILIYKAFIVVMMLTVLAIRGIIL